MPSPSAQQIDEALLRFGHEEFRPGQREAVEALLEDGRILLVAPTGGGKSLTYQLPASILPGTTIVVSPLVSLMHDQVAALDQIGVAATYLASTLTSEDARTRMAKLAAGHYKMVYVAPERLALDGFRSLISKVDCPLIAVDEAHCISEWGHDFRPDYMQIGELVTAMPDSRVLACTATATPIVRDEILERLGLAPNTPQFIHGFARPNLALRVYEVRSRRERDQLIDNALLEAIGAPGSKRDSDSRSGCAIIYSPTRRLTEEESQRLSERGWDSLAYHAGLPGAVRDNVQSTFQRGEIDVIVATNAFGMGIDRPDVRLVAHLAPPGSVEAYYQEVGRAGRDGEPAVGMLAVSPGDMAVRRHLIESPVDNRAPDPEAAQHRWNLFLELMRWAEGGSCRHDAILRYFGDEEETLAGCGHCDNCLRLNAGIAEDDAEEVTLLVRKALSGVARVHGRFGLQLAAKLLRGVDDSRLEWSGLADTKTFGILSDRSEDWITRLLRRCVTAGWVDFHGGNRPVVVLTDDGHEVMIGNRPVRLLLPPTRSAADSSRTSTKRGPKPGGPTAQDQTEELDEHGRALFEALRVFRLDLAREQSVPPYVIASDRTLRDIVLLKPRTIDELQMAHGIGPSKAEKYGSGLLKVVQDTAEGADEHSR